MFVMALMIFAVLVFCFPSLCSVPLGICFYSIKKRHEVCKFLLEILLQFYYDDDEAVFIYNGEIVDGLECLNSGKKFDHISGNIIHLR